VKLSRRSLTDKWLIDQPAEYVRGVLMIFAAPAATYTLQFCFFVVCIIFALDCVGSAEFACSYRRTTPILRGGRLAIPPGDSVSEPYLPFG